MLACRNPIDRIPKVFRNTPKLCAYVIVVLCKIGDKYAKDWELGDIRLFGDFLLFLLIFELMCDLILIINHFEVRVLG